MEPVKPFVRCSDYWPFKIPDNVLAEYKALLNEKQITKPTVIRNNKQNSTLISYQANQPHEWIKERLRKVFMGGE